MSVVPTSRRETSLPDGARLIERLVERENMNAAYKRVKANKGSAGTDGVGTEELFEYIRKNWAEIKEQLLNGTYRPKPIRRVEIPKPDGGKRKLGIPTVMDRVIQQALHQVLSPIFEPEFSENSYGFRSGRNAQQAVLKAQEYQKTGKRWVVDMDLAKFFDEVNHDRLMTLIRKRVKDKNILVLIRRYLRTGVMENGLAGVNEKGTPQGGNLSPLLSNIVLDELDKELERRGHSFCRYADDCNIYVRSKRAGERVMRSVTNFVETKLKLKVNKEKSAVARPWERKFLGYSFTNERTPRIKVAPQSVKRFEANMRTLFRKGRGRNLEKFIREELNAPIRGWIEYFRMAETKRFAEDLDGWIRRKLRCIIWRQWKNRWTRKGRLEKFGFVEEHAVRTAFNGRAGWWNSGARHMHSIFPKKFFDSIGLVSMVDRLCSA
jgi:RNA-directed DNA polymerase